MAAVSDLALGIAPIAGGLALGAAAGYLKGPDIRKAIKQDMDLLDQLPPEEVERRAELQRRIDSRIDDLVVTVDRYQRGAADSYRGGFRDILLLTCASCLPRSGGASIIMRAAGYRCLLFSC